MNKTNLWKKIWLAVGTWLLTLWISFGPLQNEALAWKIKDRVCNTLCTGKAEYWLIAHKVWENNFKKWQQVWVIKKVCFWDEELDWEWWWYVMMSIEYNPKIHWKFNVLECNTETYWWNQPTIERKNDIIVLVASKSYILPWTDFFYRVNLEDYTNNGKKY